MNSIYGITGSPISALYNVYLASSITTIGVSIIKVSEKLA